MERQRGLGGAGESSQLPELNIPCPRSTEATRTSMLNQLLTGLAAASTVGTAWLMKGARRKRQVYASGGKGGVLLRVRQKLEAAVG
jgi:hypothetical protein